MNCFVYILKCRDNSLYTGWTNDVVQRFFAHSKGKGAKYTRGRGPVKLCYYEILDNKNDALKRERSIKKLTRRKKLELIADFHDECGFIKQCITEEKI